MTDPILATTRETLRTAVTDMRRCFDGASPETLNWRPAGDDTNSIAVLAVHSMTSTRSWFAVALGSPLPERDRPSEFRATSSGAGALTAFVDEMARDCVHLLDDATDVDWSTQRKTHARPNPDHPDHFSAVWAMLHALEHLREHTGQLLLPRQLADAHLRSASPSS